MRGKEIITTRQLIMVLLLSVLALKVLLLPNLMAIVFGRDSYLFLLVMLLSDYTILILFLLLIKRYPGMTFYQIVELLLGKMLAKVVYVLLALFFFTKCCGLFQSTFVYLNENLYTTYSIFVFAFPFLVVLVYSAMRGEKCLGRILECTFPVILLGFLVASGVGAMRADITNLLPFFENRFDKTMSMASFSYWFGDYIILIMFFGRIKGEKHFNKKILISCGAIILALVAFYAIVYAKYGYNTITHTNAISDLLQVQPSSSDIGSFDWILILIWDTALFVSCLGNAFGFIFCVRTLFPKLSQVGVAIFLAASIFAACYAFAFNIYSFVEFAQKSLYIFSFGVQSILPNILFLVSFVRHGKTTKYAKDYFGSRQASGEKI